MKFIILDTTDNRHNGVIFESNEQYLKKDLRNILGVEVNLITKVNNNPIILICIGSNYTIILKEVI